MAATGHWYIATDNLVHLTGLKDGQGEYVNDVATVTGQLQDGKGNVIEGADSVAFSYVRASDGNWDGIVPAVDALKPNVMYRLVVAIASGGRRFTGRVSLTAQWYQL